MVQLVDSVLLLAVALCVVEWTPTGEAQPLVVGSVGPVVATPGQDVLLPCRLDPPVSARLMIVLWSKPDLKPDPADRQGRVGYVFFYRNQYEVKDMKIQSYVMRTELSPAGLEQGNISLKITNVTEEDQGRYKCSLPKLNSGVKEAIVELVVKPRWVDPWTVEVPLHPTDLQSPSPKDETGVTDGRRNRLPVLAVFLIVLMVGAGVLGCSIKEKNQNKKCRTNETPRRTS